MRWHQTFRTFGLALAATLLVASSHPIQAQTAVVRARSIDALLESAKYLAKMAGQEAHVAQLEGLLNQVTGGKGLAGVDHSRPVGLYASLLAGGGGQPVIAFIPVSDRDKALDLIRVLGVKIEGDGDSLIELKPQNGDNSYLRFSKDYAFVSQRLDLLQGELPDIAGLPPFPDEATLVTASVDLKPLPYEFRQLGLAALRKQSQDQAEKDSARKPGESDAAHRGRVAGMRFATDRGLRLLEELHGLNANLKIDPKTNRATLDLAIEVNPKSDVGRSFERFGEARSAFTAFARDAAVHGVISVPIAIELQSLFRTGFRDGLQKAIDKETNSRKRELGSKLLNTLDRSLFPDRYDIAAAIRGPLSDGQYVILFGSKVPGARDLENVLLDALKDFPPPSDQLTVQVDHSRHESTRIHRVTFAKFPDRNAETLYGSPELYVAYRDDMVVAAFGKHGAELMPSLLDDLQRPAEGGTSPIQLDFRLARLGPLAVDEPGRKFRELTAEYSKDNPDHDQIRVSLSGGASLKLSLEFDTHLLKLVDKLRPK
ncbi:MAG: hypothetical protein HZA46_23740 [Planctomycetales bacterium]|nr:hypothetical protein [Planctomycetales bacterium]